jgi:hypothetical protein
MCSTICVTEKFVFLFGGGANATDFGCDELLVLNRGKKILVNDVSNMSTESKQWSRVSGKELAYGKWMQKIFVITNQHFLLVAAPTDHLDVGLVLGDVTQQIAAGKVEDWCAELICLCRGTQNDRISFKYEFWVHSCWKLNFKLILRVKLMLSEGGLPPQEEKLDLLKIVFGDNNPFTTYTPFADVKPPSDPPPPYSPYPNQYSS